MVKALYDALNHQTYVARKVAGDKRVKPYPQWPDPAKRRVVKSRRRLADMPGAITTT